MPFNKYLKDGVFVSFNTYLKDVYFESFAI